MKDFSGKIAVVTGGGTGMGRELCRQLVAEGCHVATCDVVEKNLSETKRLCEAEAAQGTRVMTCIADVSREVDFKDFADAIRKNFDTDQIHLLFNNAGIGGGGSMVASDREQWEKTFNVCWGGVYFGVRTFLPMLMKANEARIVNTSSVNGFWASIGMLVPHTAYSAAKFAVKGFTEALINDLRINAPHVKCSVVMPGHIGTSIAINSREILSGHSAADMSEKEIGEARKIMSRMGVPADGFSDDDIRKLVAAQGERFRDEAPMTAAAAAKVILDGVREGRWRILVGEDAVVLDRMVRETPEEAYEQAFFDRFAKAANWRIAAGG